MRHTLSCCLLIASISVVCNAARGHFVWLDVAGNERGNGKVEVYFSETADPGEPHLVEKIARTKVSGACVEGRRIGSDPDEGDARRCLRQACRSRFG